MGLLDSSGVLLKPHIFSKPQGAPGAPPGGPPEGPPEGPPLEGPPEGSPGGAPRGPPNGGPRLARGMDEAFYVDLPPPNLRERKAPPRPRRFYP
ncbi:hypothetical protein, conserved [Eimeria tenella]|uniref:Uncharacterized protein n=1 Tax=Eimeria tenella TaxID=5802 RepID=U6KZB6_EIMTE|nr:hypothetical protein, conserved [Eimeria tenella]CDJ43487.1 hypothetical protein, conserved [Eimeria tenella]|eukprot:XP_013234237.1 hypothetical protein, conserved [Eimeria tenella]